MKKPPKKKGAKKGKGKTGKPSAKDSKSNTADNNALNKAELKQRMALAARQLAEAEEGIANYEIKFKELKTQHEQTQRLLDRQDEIIKTKLDDVKRLSLEKIRFMQILKQTKERAKRFQSTRENLKSIPDTSQDEFKSVPELLENYEFLWNTSSELMPVENARELNRRRLRALEGPEKGKDSGVAGLFGTDAIELSEELLRLEEKITGFNNDLVHIKNTAVERAGDIGRVQAGIYNLYSQVCKKLNRPADIPTNDSLQQLDYIRNSTGEMKKLRDDIQTMLNRAKRGEDPDKFLHLYRRRPSARNVPEVETKGSGMGNSDSHQI